VLLWTLLGGCGRLAFDARGDANGAVGDGAGDVPDGAPGDPTLLLYFSFENGLLVDDSGGNDATCTSCPTLTTRGGEQAVQFDGSTNCLFIPLPLAERPTTGVTAAAWVRIDQNNTHTMFGAPYDTITPTFNSFEIYSSTPDLTTMHINNSTSVSVPTPVGAWHHVAIVWGSGVLRSFLDGAPFNSGGSSVPLWSVENLTIGCDIDFGVEIDHFDGAIDDVRLYSRALDPSQIAALAQ
jgi:Concanavalin A-like lectin/glucanases superfamily